MPKGAGSKLRRQRAKPTAWKRRAIRAAVCERDGWRCQVCGREVDPDAEPGTDLAPTMDHIVRVTEGGPWTVANLRLLCFTCNAARD